MPAGGAVACEALTKRFGSTDALDGVTLSVEPGEILALLGPSGCGKTTFLRLVAGFERPDGGRVWLDGAEVAGPSSFVPPERRGVGFVFQDYALFPHLDVAGNVAFGIRDKHARAPRAAEVLALVGLDSFGDRRLHELSGGQQQRVALARALAPQPSLVLLDEPFSNLDADLRARVRAEVRGILRAAGATAVFVTHDQSEAFDIADRIVVLRDGRVEQAGRPEEIYHTPATRFVADFVGEADFVPAQISAREIVSELGAFAVATDGVDAGSGELMVRPEDVVIEPDPAGAARVVARRFQGPLTFCSVRLASGRVVTSAHLSQALLAPGESVSVRFEPDHLVLFRGETRVAWIPARARTGTDSPG